MVEGQRIEKPIQEGEKKGKDLLADLFADFDKTHKAALKSAADVSAEKKASADERNKKALQVVDGFSEFVAGQGIRGIEDVQALQEWLLFDNDEALDESVKTKLQQLQTVHEQYSVRAESLKVQENEVGLAALMAAMRGNEALNGLILDVQMNLQDAGREKYGEEATEAAKERDAAFMKTEEVTQVLNDYPELGREYIEVEATLEAVKQNRMEKMLGLDMKTEHVVLDRALKAKAKVEEYNDARFGARQEYERIYGNKTYRTKSEMLSDIDNDVNIHHTVIRQKEFAASEFMGRVAEILDGKTEQEKTEILENDGAFEIENLLVPMSKRSGSEMHYPREESMGDKEIKLGDQKGLSPEEGVKLLQELLRYKVLNEFTKHRDSDSGLEGSKALFFLNQYLLSFQPGHRTSRNTLSQMDPAQTLAAINEHDPDFFISLQTQLVATPYHNVSKQNQYKGVPKFEGQQLNAKGTPYRPGRGREDAVAIQRNLKSIEQPFDEETYKERQTSEKYRILSAEAGVQAAEDARIEAIKALVEERKKGAPQLDRISNLEANLRGSEQRVAKAQAEVEKLKELNESFRDQYAELKTNFDRLQAEAGVNAAESEKNVKIKSLETKLARVKELIEQMPSRRTITGREIVDASQVAALGDFI